MYFRLPRALNTLKTSKRTYANKVINSMEEAIKDVKDGSTIIIGGKFIISLS